MGKTSKPSTDTPKPKSVKSPSFKPESKSLSTQTTSDSQPPKPKSIRDIEMPSSAKGVTAASLNANQKNVVKHSVQHIFRKNTFGAPVGQNKIHTLVNATDDLGKIMAEAAAKRKLQKQAAKKSNK